MPNVAVHWTEGAARGAAPEVPMQGLLAGIPLLILFGLAGAPLQLIAEAVVDV